MNSLFDLYDEDKDGLVNYSDFAATLFENNKEVASPPKTAQKKPQQPM